MRFYQKNKRANEIEGPHTDQHTSILHPGSPKLELDLPHPAHSYDPEIHDNLTNADQHLSCHVQGIPVALVSWALVRIENHLPIETFCEIMVGVSDTVDVDRGQ